MAGKITITISGSPTTTVQTNPFSLTCTDNWGNQATVSGIMYITQLIYVAPVTGTPPVCKYSVTVNATAGCAHAHESSYSAALWEPANSNDVFVQNSADGIFTSNPVSQTMPETYTPQNSQDYDFNLSGSVTASASDVK